MPHTANVPYASSAEQSDREGRRFLFLSLALLFLLALLSVAALGLGRFEVAFPDLISTLMGDAPSRVVGNVVWNVRLPRVLLALLAGAGLALSGAAFQSLFANPLASPDTLGVATGASFGAVLGILWGFTGLGIQLASLASGLLAVGLVLLIARDREGAPILMIVLAGIVVGALFTALVSLVKFVADPQDVLPAVTFWMMGALTGASHESLLAGSPMILAGAAVLWLLRWRLNAATLPADEAKSLGIRVGHLRALVIVSATMVTASVVSMCGLIGWVGLLVPHAARMLFGSNNRFVLPASVLLGAMFLLVVDTAARTLSASEIPVSILTAVVGAPFFIFLLRRTGGLSR